MNQTFMYINHQDKGKAYVDALLSDGWRQVSELDGPEICLTDADVTPLRTANLKRISARGTKIFVYPHAGRPPVHYDFHGYPQSGTVTAQFVSAPGHAEVLKVIGYEGPVHVAGWSLCQQKSFKPVYGPQRILFAPVHANGSGWLHDVDKDINARAFERIHKYAVDNQFRLSVRYLGDLTACGLKRVNGVNFYQGQPDQCYVQIDAADLVVSTQTFQYLAVARGKPTIGMGESVSPKIGGKPSEFAWAKSWDKYKHLMKFPLDILEDVPVDELVQRACSGDPEVAQWRRELIGESFCAKGFLETIDSYVREDICTYLGV